MPGVELEVKTTTYSYLDHRYRVGLASNLLHWTPGSMPRDGARGQNLVTIQKIGCLRQSILEVHMLTTTCQKAFILGP